MATAICILEPGLFQLVSSGVHPLHHTCLDIYTCLASAWRLHARGHKQSPRLAAVAHARAALYTVLLAHGLRQLLNTGDAVFQMTTGTTMYKLVVGDGVMPVEALGFPKEAVAYRFGSLLLEDIVVCIWCHAVVHLPDPT